MAIDGVGDEASERATEAERLRRDIAALHAELRGMERQYAANARELAAVYASRSWRVAERLKRLFGRRPARPAPAPGPARFVPIPPGETPAPIRLIVLPGAPAATADSLGGAACDIVQLGADTAGVVAACNHAAAEARGGYIALWDGVSAPQPGWLPALLDAFARREGLGMAGAILLGPDGHIAAAGLAIRPDGGLAPLGHGERPDHPDVASLAPVEALPLGAAMLPGEIWHRFGGLDEAIAVPALALADLALRLRQAGLGVACQPFARLVAPPAPPPAPDPWAEAFGRWRLRRRRATLGHGLAVLGLAPPPPPRALVVDNFVPTPDRDSGSGDIHWMLRILVAFDYEVTLLPAGDLARADGYVDDLRRHGVRVVADGFAASAEDFLARAPAPFDLVMLYRGSLAAGRLLDRLVAHSPQARLVFNTVDLHFLRLEREAVLARSPAMLEQAFAAEQAELAAIARADCSVLLSSAEQRLIADLLPRAPTRVIPIARDIPGRRAPFGPRAGVLFVGSFRHQPNVDAILWFTREIWPLIRQRLPTTLAIVGADAPPGVLALASEHDGISLRGHVEDLDAELARCRLTVAPLRFGAGIKGKIVSSLAAGVPCVASAVAAEGMDLTDGVHLCLAATPQDFAASVIAVHQQEQLWNALSDGGLAFARETFSVGAARRRVAAMLRDLGLPDGGA